MKDPCSDKCRFKCTQKFTEEVRKQRHWRQKPAKSTVINLVTEKEKARNRTADPENSRRHCSREYTLMKKGERIEVCQKCF